MHSFNIGSGGSPLLLRVKYWGGGGRQLLYLGLLPLPAACPTPFLCCFWSLPSLCILFPHLFPLPPHAASASQTSLLLPSLPHPCFVPAAPSIQQPGACSKAPAQSHCSSLQPIQLVWGLGSGRALCPRLEPERSLLAHGARIREEQRLQGGSCFTFSNHLPPHCLPPCSNGEDGFYTWKIITRL